jgi:hypothetical protein
MKKYSILLAAGLAGCHAAATNVQLIDLDDNTRLVVVVEGAPTSQTPVAMVIPGPKPGDPIHRVLRSADGRILFAYDLEVKKGGGSEPYTFLLKPAVKGPTFASVREAALSTREGSFRVELMEQPATGRRIEDVYSVLENESFGTHLMRLHNQFFHWVHGG